MTREELIKKNETALRAAEQVILIDMIRSEIKSCGIDHTFEILDKYIKKLSEYDNKICNDCKYDKYPTNTEPCLSCIYYGSHISWEPKEE